jgi:pilus assembly protein CpaC
MRCCPAIVSVFLAFGSSAVLGQPAPLTASRPAATPTSGSGSTFAMPPSTSRPARATVDQTPVQGLVIEAGSGKVINLPGSITNVFVADPKVVEVRPASPTTLFVFGTAPGRTTMAALDAAGHVVAQYELTVRPSAFNAAEAGSAISRAMPGSNIRVETQLSGLAITGQVATAADADRVTSIARAYLADKQTLDNRLSVASSTQISLRVRIAEMSRSVSREIGVNWSTIQGLGQYATIGLATANAVTASSSTANVLSGTYASGNTNLNGFIDALAQDNLVHTLAEPNLTTMSGEPASFLVGGEFPIPIAQTNNTVTVDFKQYGINLSFVPTVLSDGRINVHVRPEVSELTTQGAVQLSSTNNSVSIPALTVRRADTTVEVGSGQSFAIAGLLQDAVTHGTSAIPFLGEIPILGALFRSDSFQRNESELVIIVTPYIVRPVSEPAALHSPDDTYAPPNDLERIMLLRQVGQLSPVKPARIPGSAGFIVQ